MLGDIGGSPGTASRIEDQISRVGRLANRLRDLRTAAGLTQEKAAERAGLSRNHYQLLESGLSDRAKRTPANPRLSTILDLAHALDCDAAELVMHLSR
ncbi:MAG: helix-turn-helix transcriptional regulator [Cellulomonadaceae bacterium]